VRDGIVQGVGPDGDFDGWHANRTVPDKVEVLENLEIIQIKLMKIPCKRRHGSIALLIFAKIQLFL